MKIMSILALIIVPVAIGFTYAEQPSEASQCKSDLIGQTMGGREKCWKFQSANQIKELVIQNKREDAQKRVYSISLILQDPRVPGKYKAEAQLVYEKVDRQWKIKHVGLISLVKIE
jgi:hypothetical protein